MFQLPRTFVALALLVHLANPVRAQVQVRWFQTFDNPGHADDTPEASAVDGSGNVYVAVRAVAPPGIAKGVLVKYSPDGTLAWTRDVLPGPATLNAVGLDPSSGDVVVVGFAPEAPVPDRDVIVARYAPDGTRRWFRRWNGPDSRYDTAHSVVVGPTGTAYVAALTQRADGDLEYAVLAYGADGAPAFASVLTDTHGPSALPGPIAIDSGGNLLVTGFGGATFASEAVVIKLAPSGALAWYRNYAGPVSDFDRGMDVAADEDGNVYVCGVTTGPSGAGDYGGLLLKYDAQGNRLWERVVDDALAGLDALDALAIDYRGHVVVAGRRSRAAGEFHAWLGQYDSQGNLRWGRSWTGDDQHFEGWFALDIDAGGGIAVAGMKYRFLDFPAFESDVEVRRYDRDGELRWAHSGLFAVPNSDYATDVAFGPGGTVVYVGSTNASPGSQSDVLVATLRDQAVPFCFGDGSAAACPCGNASAPGNQVGCRNSLGTGGKLVDAGVANLSGDSLELRVSGLTGTVAVFLQSGTSLSGVPFGDGISCLGNPSLRLGAETVANGAASYPGPGGSPVSVRGFVLAPGERFYQVAYRDGASFCTPSTVNRSNGLGIAWAP